MDLHQNYIVHNNEDLTLETAEGCIRDEQQEATKVLFDPYIFVLMSIITNNTDVVR